MGIWEMFVLGLLAGGVFGVIFVGILQAGRCGDCQAEIIRSLQGKIKQGE